MYQRGLCVRGLCDTSALEHKHHSELDRLFQRYDISDQRRLCKESTAVEIVKWLHCNETVSRIQYGTRKTLLIIERQPSLFANFIPENPIIAASTTPLERRYLRHFFTYIPISTN